ncbi:MAG: ABC transporter ATP-binding protein/permease [Clostridia bacterium]|nr:ABC transporter ATP-binding protein/permease [Clostridia bacterium]
MLEIRDAVKTYKAAGVSARALQGISIAFRKNEFVAVLGQSGSGKTTLLNIIGGLDHYDSGDMLVQGRSTKQFTERDWDNYRNHRVGFVFQSYHLIPHQTVLGNVELALTLSGVGKAERRARAREALERVGLGDQTNKRPNQLSGGQMQRVAIARALVNDPEILLADEPTGALDSATGIQVMEILKEVARDRLVIMVTHNPDLADTYATRIVRLEDGRVISDSDPCGADELSAEAKAGSAGAGEKRPSMGFGTALGLSFRNLMTKKGRTILTSFAGSIGIIGIALILSISTGISRYIDRVQQDTLSGYPLEIESSQMDMTGMMMNMSAGRAGAANTEREEGRIYSGDVMSRMLNAMNATMTHNDLKSFKAFLDRGGMGIEDLTSDIRYSYGNQLSIWRDAGDQGWIQVNPSQVLSLSGLMGSDNSVMELMGLSSMSYSLANLDVFTQLLDNRELMDQQYEVLTGRMPSSWDEAVIIVTERGMISDYTLYALGLRDQSEIAYLTKETLAGNEITVEQTSYSYDELMALSFRLVPDSYRYRENEGGIWVDMSGDAAYMAGIYASSPEIRIVGILKPREDAVTTQSGASGGIGYLGSLQQKAIELVNSSPAVTAQMASPEVDIFSGLPFEGTEAAETGNIVLDRSVIPEQYRAFVQNMSDEQIIDMAKKYGSMYGLDISFTSASTLESNLKTLGVIDPDDPVTISIYPRDFESKERIAALIAEYNKEAGEEGAISYTDYIGLLLSSVTTIVNAVSYVLIAFVAISLVVSSIMIGVITYISVMERTREIGILRAIGASRRDVGRVFNAETMIIGLVSGMIGICATLLLNILVNIVLHNLTGISATAVLPVGSALILILISMGLTFISGLIPSASAGRKDPVAALRTE